MKKTRTVIWISQSNPSVMQIEDLQRMYGLIKVSLEVRPTDPEMLLEQVDRIAAKEDVVDVVVMAPYSILDYLCRHGLRPLHPVAEKAHGNKAEWYDAGQGYRHVEFRRAMRVELILEAPNASKWRREE